MTERSRFAGGDQAYLRDVQYRNSEKLTARANLHAKYGAGDWFSWWASQYVWPEQAEVLEVGCGAGWVWTGATEILPRGLALTLTDQSRGMVAEALANVGAPKRYRSLAAWRPTRRNCHLEISDSTWWWQTTCCTTYPNQNGRWPNSPG